MDIGSESASKKKRKKLEKTFAEHYVEDMIPSPTKTERSDFPQRLKSVVTPTAGILSLAYNLSTKFKPDCFVRLAN